MIAPLITQFAAECASKGLFGLIPWYNYINDSEHFKGCELHKFTLLPRNGHATDVPLVLLAIVDDLLRIAGIVAVAFVLVGALKYVTSQGNPEDTASAQSTIVNALIGLAIATVAVGLVSFLGHALGS